MKKNKEFKEVKVFKALKFQTLFLKDIKDLNLLSLTIILLKTVLLDENVVQ